jgi:hypothetical protein
MRGRRDLAAIVKVFVWWWELVWVEEKVIVVVNREECRERSREQRYLFDRCLQRNRELSATASRIFGDAT